MSNDRFAFRQASEGLKKEPSAGFIIQLFVKDYTELPGQFARDVPLRFGSIPREGEPLVERLVARLQHRFPEIAQHPKFLARTVVTSFNAAWVEHYAQEAFGLQDFRPWARPTHPFD